MILAVFIAYTAACVLLGVAADRWLIERRDRPSSLEVLHRMGRRTH